MNGRAVFRGGIATVAGGVVLGPAVAFAGTTELGAIVAGVMIAFGFIVASYASGIAEAEGEFGSADEEVDNDV